MKKYLTVLILICHLFLLPSCKNARQQDKTTVNNEEKIKIKWLGQWYGEGKKELLIRELARDFSFINQKYDVELVFPHEMANKDASVSAFSLTTDTIKKMIRDNVWPYDLMLCDAYIYQNVAAAIGDEQWGEKYLVDFKNEPWFIKAHKNSVLNTNQAIANFGGIAPGTYIEGIWNVLYVSTAVEEKLGIKVKRLDMTLDDYTEYARAVYNYNQNHEDKITFLWKVRPPKVFDQLVLSALGKDTADTNDEAFAALENVYSGLTKLNAYEPNTEYIKSSSEYDLKEDKTLFVYNSSWITLIWQRKNPQGENKMHPCELPSLKDKKASTYSGMYNAIFVVPKNAKNKEAAIELMKFISSSETAEKWVKYSKCPTGLDYRTVYADFNTDEINQFSQHIKNKYNDNLAEPVLDKILFRKSKNITYSSEEVMNGNMSPREAVAVVKKQVTR